MPTIIFAFFRFKHLTILKIEAGIFALTRYIFASTLSTINRYNTQVNSKCQNERRHYEINTKTPELAGEVVAVVHVVI